MNHESIIYISENNEIIREKVYEENVILILNIINTYILRFNKQS